MRNYEIVAIMLDFEDWLKEKNLVEGTISHYMQAVNKFLMTSPDIESIDSYNTFIFQFSIKKRSVYYYDALKLFIKFHFDKNPKQAILLRNLLKADSQEPKRIVHYLDDDTREQVIKLILNYKHRIMAKIQNVTGVRAGDILRLKRGNISYEAYNDEVVVLRIDFEGKGRKHFIKWIFDPDLQIQIDLFIKANILDTEYYFLERKGIPGISLFKEYNRNYEKYLKDLKQALRVYGIEYKEWATHDFRRAFARNVWNKTKDPVLLKEMMNHSQFETTLRYLRGSGLQVKDVYYELSQKH